MKIIIDGELMDVDSVHTGGYLPNVYIGKMDFYVAMNEEDAGKATRKYWQEMAENDKREFLAIIGEERLVGWALGESDNFGCSSLNDFLDIVEEHPEEEFGSYDGSSVDVSVDFGKAENIKDFFDEMPEGADAEKFEEEQQNKIQAELDELTERLGYEPTVGYRHN